MQGFEQIRVFIYLSNRLHLLFMSLIPETNLDSNSGVPRIYRYELERFCKDFAMIQNFCLTIQRNHSYWKIEKDWRVT